MVFFKSMLMARVRLGFEEEEEEEEYMVGCRGA